MNNRYGTNLLDLYYGYISERHGIYYVKIYGFRMSCLQKYIQRR